MATMPETGLTYEDLQTFPEDNFRREIIDGELIVTAAPATRHQSVVLRLGSELLAHCDQFGGKVFVALTDVFFSDRTWSSRTCCTFGRRTSAASRRSWCVRHPTWWSRCPP